MKILFKKLISVQKKRLLVNTSISKNPQEINLVGFKILFEQVAKILFYHFNLFNYSVIFSL